jgi:hypothetical protein
MLCQIRGLGLGVGVVKKLSGVYRSRVVGIQCIEAEWYGRVVGILVAPPTRYGVAPPTRYGRVLYFYHHLESYWFLSMCLCVYVSMCLCVYVMTRDARQES